MADTFEFTYDIYTGEKNTAPYSSEYLMGALRCAYVNQHDYVVLGGQDKGKVGTKYPIDDECIVRIRHSPEYHDAVFAHILEEQQGHQTFLTRIRHFESFVKGMRINGVLGPIRLIREEDIDLPHYITPQQFGSENDAKHHDTESDRRDSILINYDDSNRRSK